MSGLSSPHQQPPTIPSSRLHSWRVRRSISTGLSRVVPWPAAFSAPGIRCPHGATLFVQHWQPAEVLTIPHATYEPRPLQGAFKLTGAIQRAAHLSELQDVCSTSRSHLNHIHIAAALSKAVRLQHTGARRALNQLCAELVQGFTPSLLQSCTLREISTVVWSLAKLQQPTPLSLLDAVCCSLQERPQLLQEATPQAVVNIAWSLACWGCNGHALLGHVLSTARGLVPRFKAQDYSNLLWAVARLAYEDGAEPGTVVGSSGDRDSSYGARIRDMVQQLTRGAAPLLPTFSDQALSTAVWACQELKHRDLQFLRAACSTLQNRLGSSSNQQRAPDTGQGQQQPCISAQELAVLVYALAKLHCTNRALLDAVARYALQQSLEQWPPWVRVRLLAAFAVAGTNHPALLQAVAAAQLHGRPTATDSAGSHGVSNDVAMGATSGSHGDSSDGTHSAGHSTVPLQAWGEWSVLPVPAGMRSGRPGAVGSHPHSLGGTAMEAATFLWSCAKLLPKQQWQQQHALPAPGGQQLPAPMPDVAVMQDALRCSAAAIVSSQQSASFGAVAMAAWGAVQLGLAPPHAQALVEMACRRLLDKLPRDASMLRLGARDLDSTVMLLWAMGSSGYGSAQVLTAVEAASPQLLPRLSARQLALVCRAYVQLQYPADQLYTTAAALMAQRTPAMSLGGVAMTLWSLASAGHASPLLMRRVAAALPAMLVAYDGSSTAGRAAVLLLWAFAAADCYSVDLFDMLLLVVQSGAKRLLPGDVAMALWACAVSGHFNAPALRVLCARVPGALRQLPPPAFIQVCWSGVHLAAPLVADWACAPARLIQVQLPQLSASELSVLLWTMAMQQLMPTATAPRQVAARSWSGSRASSGAGEAEPYAAGDSSSSGSGSGAQAESVAAALSGLSLVDPQKLDLDSILTLAEALSMLLASPLQPLRLAAQQAIAALQGGQLLQVLAAEWARAQRRRHPLQADVARAARAIGHRPCQLRTHTLLPLASRNLLALPESRAVLVLTDAPDFATNVHGQPLGPLCALIQLLRARRWLVAIVYAETFRELRWASRQDRYLRLLLESAGVQAPD